MKDSTFITRHMLTKCMADMRTCCAEVNKVISPDKELQPHKGATLGRIVQTSTDCYSSICLPQWCKTDNLSGSKVYHFRCKEDGTFIDWI